MSNFIKDFVDKISNDLNLFREEGRFNYSDKYDIFVAFYILGVFDAKKFLIAVDGKDNINKDVVNKVKILKKEYDGVFNHLIEDNVNDNIKGILKEEILKVYYQGFIHYIKLSKDDKAQKILRVLSVHYNIEYDGNYNLAESSLRSIIDELNFRYVILDVYNFKNKIR